MSGGDGLTRDLVVGVILSALERLRARDQYLIDKGTHECALTHRLAVYLEQSPLLRDWHVDCEYNRMWKLDELQPKELHGRRIRPDIIVHRRGPRGPNLLALEAKLRAGRGDEYDREKLEGLRQDPFRYACTAFVTFAPLQLWIDPDVNAAVEPYLV